MSLSLSEAVGLMEDYVKERSAEAAKMVATASAAEKSSLGDLSQSALQSKTLAQVRSAAASNPALQAAADTASQIGTTLVQKMATDALSKVSLAPIQAATQNFMQAWATLSTFDTEIAMEMARNSARNISSVLDKRDAVLGEITTELTALHNACAVILNSSPFMDRYINDLIAAHRILRKAEQRFEAVISRLSAQGDPKIPNSGPSFLKGQFNAGVKDLEQAKNLILPDRDVDISSITAAGDFVSATLDRQTNKQAIAAVVAIPGISLKLGRKALEYTQLTVEMNLLILTFLDAIEGWISGFEKNTNIYRVTNDHVQAGLSQLSTLIAEMDATLYPDMILSSDVHLNPASLRHLPKITASATVWGVKLQAIIEWMKLNPGVGAAQIDQTSESVNRYLMACSEIRALRDISVNGGILPISEGREDSQTAVKALSTLLLDVNTLVATRQTRKQITDEFSRVRGVFRGARYHSNRIRKAINPFIATQTTLPGPARAALSQALGLANKYGLDRVAGLVSAGRTRELFKVTPETATYAGAAVAGMNQVIALALGEPNTSTAQIKKLEDLRDSVDRQKQAQDIEAGRSYSASLAAARDSIARKLEQIKETIAPAREAAAFLDSTNGRGPESTAENDLSSAIPNFSANVTLTT